MSHKRVDRIYWLTLIILAVAAVCMNVVGLYLDSNTDRTLPPEVLFLDIIDRTLLLFFAEGRGFPIDDDNFLSRLARITSVIVMIGAIVKLALEILAQRLQKLKISRLKGHMIICGFGEAGQAFALNLSKDTPILIIDPNLSEADEFQAYENGWYFIKANARESTALLTAGLTKAKGMVISCGEDTVNMEVLEQAQQLIEDKKHAKPFNFMLDVSNEQLSESISDQFIVNNLHESIELFTFSRPRLTARDFVWNVPLSEYARFRNQDRMQLIFIGYDAYAEAMIDKLVSAYIVSTLSPLQISIFTKAPDSELEALLDKYRFANDYLYIEGYESDELWATLKTKSFDTITALFVFDEEDESCVNRALSTRDFLLQNNRDQAPIFMRLDRDLALKNLLVGVDQTNHMGEVLQAFGMNNKICHPDLIKGELENIAIQLHEQTLEFSTRELDDAEKQQKVSSYQPWRLLSETKRNAKRRLVDHIPAKLAAIGIHHQPGYGLKLANETISFSKDADCLEHLTELEHNSWSAGKYAEGWIPAKVCDDRRKTHDSLQYRYHELTETLKGYKRDQIQILDQNILKHSRPGQATNKPEVVLTISANVSLNAEEANALKSYLLETLAKELTEHGRHCFYTIICELNPNAETFVLDVLSGWFAKEKLTWRSIVQSTLTKETLFANFNQLTNNDYIVFAHEKEKTAKQDTQKRLMDLFKRVRVEWIIPRSSAASSDSRVTNHRIKPGYDALISISKDETNIATEPVVSHQLEISDKLRNYAVQISA